MSGIRFAEKLAGAPWMCSQDHLEFLHGIFLSYMDRGGQLPDIQAIEEQIGRPLDNARQVTIRGRTARIPVTGTIFRRANLFTAMSGGTSAGVLAQDLRASADDPSIDSILLVFDSPGGEAAGIHELAGMIRQIRESDTRIESYCDGDCASAAYWLASATERITADATAVVGSIGVVTQVRNPEAAGKQQTLEFTNSRSPKKRINPATESGRAALQEFVDDMGDEFIEAVAENRGVSVETVEQDFGQGFVMTGRKGVDVGLVDALGSEEEVLARLNSNGPYFGKAAAMETGVKADSNAEGVLSRIRAMLGADVPTVPIEATTNERGNVKLEDRDGATVLVADNGEELELAAEDRNRLVEERQTEREAALSEENEDLKRQLSEANAQTETLRAHTADGQARLKAEQVERELDTFAGEGVPKYMLDLARPALLSGGDEEAERWRSVLAGAKGSIEYGERGEANGTPPGEMTDDQKVKAAIAERGLDPVKDYGKVAGELVATGEIRRGEASQEGE